MTLQSDSVLSNSTLNTGGGSGGGIYNSVGSLTLKGTTVKNNYAVTKKLSQPGLGGGIYNTGGGKVVVTSGGLANIVGFYGNNAYSGGAIYNGDGTVNLEQVKISSGWAIANGGGVYNANGSMTIVGCNVYGNNAAQGGGIFVAGGTLILAQSDVSLNIAASASRGGVLIYDGAAFIGAGTISNNTADNGGGGGVYVNSGTLTIGSNEIIGGGNTAMTGGGMCLVGGITNFTKYCQVSGNQATVQGVGVWWQLPGRYTLNPNPGALNDEDDPGGVPA